MIKIKFTVFTKPLPGIMTKKINLVDSQIVKDGSQCWLSTGTAETIDIPFNELLTFLDNIGTNQALSWGISKHEKTKIVAQALEASTQDAISRTKKHFDFAKGKPGLLMLDSDTGISTVEFVAIIEQVMPELFGVGRIERSSCSSDIYADDKFLTTEGTGRVYYLLDNAAEIHRIGKTLHQRLILAGHGHIFITRDGAKLVRSLVDDCVWLGCWLDFVAPPVLGNGLERQAPKAQYFDGPALVTADIEDLTNEEQLRLETIISGLKALSKPEADRVKAQYTDDEAVKLVKDHNISKSDAVAVVKQRMAGNLIDGDVLHFDDLGTVSVSDVLNDPAKYDLETLADPLEPDYGGGRCKAIFYENKGNGSPTIHSFAHGGRTYRLGVSIELEIQDKAEFLRKEVEKLAHLEPIAFDIKRKELMKEHNLNAKTIDDVVAKIRAGSEEESTSIVSEVEPWPNEVDGANLLEEISSTISRFVVLPDLMHNVLALWVMLSYCFDNFRILPQIAIYSPEKRCGKSTLMEVIEAFSHRALLASNISPAAVYRSIEKYHPTLFIDEADTFFKENIELQGICNSGHTKKGAYVIRTTGDNHDPAKFSTWCPKAIAVIGELKDTQHDRSIIVHLRRRLPGEHVQKLPIDFEGDCTDIRRKCKRWAEDHDTALKLAKPVVPETGNDRQQDNWTPLFAIADCVGGEWPEKVKQALLSVAEEPDDNESVVLRLLRDIRGVFTDTKKDKLTSQELVDLLKSIKDARWNDWNYGRGLSQNSLSHLLKHFKVKPKQQWIHGRNQRGYSLDQFQDTFKRYLTASDPSKQSARVLELNDCASFSDYQSARNHFPLAVEKPQKPTAPLSPSTLAVQNVGTGEHERQTQKVVNPGAEMFM